MIIWFILFLIIVAISLILAYLSMRDFPEIPEKKNYGLFLIQNPALLTVETLDFIALKANKGEIVSLERLFKGGLSAMVVFGPKALLAGFKSLNLLELEDYTKTSLKLVAWEVGPKNGIPSNPFEGLPELLDSEQFWWQLVLHSKKDKFTGVIRAAVLSQSEERLKTLTPVLQNLKGLVKLPRPYTSEQIYSSLQERALLPLSVEKLEFSSQEVLRLLFIT